MSSTSQFGVFTAPSLSRWGALTILLGLLATTSGCIGFAANLLHAIHGNNRPAEYAGLKNQKVAVIVSTEEGINSNVSAKSLSSLIQVALTTNMKKKVDVVRQQEIDKWLDANGRTEADFVELGRDVGADVIVAVDLMNLKLTDGPTLYRGQSDIDVVVYDIKDGGKPVFSKQYNEFSYPSMGGRPISDTSESKFRSAYLSVVANRVSSLFYQIEATSDFALDATSNRF